MFKGRKIAIATKHQKESVIAPLLYAFDFHPIVPDIDTDILGTFSGEVERSKSPYETARQKCYMAIHASGCDIAISSEGSFGSHPTVFLGMANQELVLMVDRKNGQEYYGSFLSAETNCSGKQIQTKEQAMEFCQGIGFPDHGVIIKDKEVGFVECFKGIRSNEKLNQVVSQMLTKYQEIWIETDMRAMFNPTRMKNIEKATKNLLEKIQSECPVCSAPGFWKSDAIPGLICSYCHQPTRSIKANKYRCKQCDYLETKHFPNGKQFEDPMYCDKCNP